MPITIGVDFRNALGYVSGGASGNGGNSNYYAEVSGHAPDYPLSFGGTNIGWEDNNALAHDGRDYNNGIDVRLAGIMFVSGGETSTFRINLPSAGTYSIQLAVGSAYGAQSNQQVVIKDNTTNVATISGNTGGAAQFLGANNTLYTSSASWAAANVVDGGGAAQTNLAFSSTIARFVLGNGTDGTAIAHLFITGPVGGAVEISPARKDLVFSSSAPELGLLMLPDADITDGGWTDQGGGTSLFAAIDEDVLSDSDYIKSSLNPNNDMCEIRLSNPSITPGQPFEVFYRYKNSGEANINLTVSLVQGTTVIASWTHNSIGTSFVTASQVLTSPQFSSITDFDDLRVRFSANAT